MKKLNKSTVAEKTEQENTQQRSSELGRAEGCCQNRRSGIVTLSVSLSLQNGEIVWAKVHTDSPEGRAFLLLSLQRKMRKREYPKLQYLISRAK